MGGQVGDTGWLKTEDETIEIIDTKRENNLPVHFSTRLPKDVTGTFTAEIDVKKRIQCECNHTATHLLHESLREVLGTHVEQKGSYVSPNSLRFDFSHFQKVSDEEIRKVEKLVAEKIRADYPLEEHREMPIEEAKALGAMALFGEKYGDKVRVVKYGQSIELCGGTHIPSTGRIGSLRVIAESSVAAGIRRIEAVTAEASENYTFMLQDSLRELRAMFNNVPNLSQTIRKAIEENAELKKQVGDYVKEKGTTDKERADCPCRRTPRGQVDCFPRRSARRCHQRRGFPNQRRKPDRRKSMFRCRHQRWREMRFDGHAERTARG